MMNLEQIKEKNFMLQEFAVKLNSDPLAHEIEPTPDKRAKTIPIGIIEQKLDEVFYGMWQTHSFESKVVGNEVHGSIVLEVTHPVTGETIKRVGAAAIQITVDALSDDEKRGMNRKLINAHALDINNKKPNALYLTFPKLKAECTKNAAISLGRFFGRDLNRKHEKTQYRRSISKPERKQDALPSADDLKLALQKVNTISDEKLKKDFLHSVASNNVTGEMIKLVLNG